MPHIPVLLKEVLETLNPKPGEFFIDGTFGNGGHAAEIAKRIKPNGIFLAVDWDKNAIKMAAVKMKRYELRKLVFANDNYANISDVLKKNKLPKADGLLLDLGFSSEQIEGRGLGFSFRRDEPLLMVYGEKQKPVHSWFEDLSEKELAGIIGKFGGERYAARVARAIKKNLPIKTTGRLAAIVENVLPKNYEHGRIHPATRTFLALRVFANSELENLEKILLALPEFIKSKGRVAIISYNSLEDKIVKTIFNNFYRQKKATLFAKKPITPSDGEIKENSRARSAKLRVIEFK